MHVWWCFINEQRKRVKKLQIEWRWSEKKNQWANVFELNTITWHNHERNNREKGANVSPPPPPQLPLPPNYWEECLLFLWLKQLPRVLCVHTFWWFYIHFAIAYTTHCGYYPTTTRGISIKIATNAKTIK